MTKRCAHYLKTLPNTRKGLIELGRCRYIAKMLGRVVVVYGRGPRKAAFEKRSKMAGNWEFGRKWSLWDNNHYRPKLDDCTRFDCYLYQRQRVSWGWRLVPAPLPVWKNS